MRVFALLPTLLSAAVPAASWKVTTYRDENCSDQLSPPLENSVGTGCKSMDGIESFWLDDAGDATLVFYNYDQCSPDNNEYRRAIQMPSGCVSKKELLDHPTLEWKGDDARSWRMAGMLLQLACFVELRVNLCCEIAPRSVGI